MSNNHCTLLAIQVQEMLKEQQCRFALSKQYSRATILVVVQTEHAHQLEMWVYTQVDHEDRLRQLLWLAGQHHS
jgi:hypothetical protein